MAPYFRHSLFFPQHVIFEISNLIFDFQTSIGNNLFLCLRSLSQTLLRKKKCIYTYT